MKLRTLVLVCALGSAAACGSTPTAASAPTNTVAAAPNISAPAAQSPTGGQLVGGLTVTLTAGSASVDQASFTLLYRFQILSDTGSVAEDSGLVSGTSWTSTKTLTPLAQFTWRVRAESQGFEGAWSPAGSFKTPEQAAAYNRPIGDWQSCASLTGNKSALVNCVWNAVHPTDSVSDMELTKRVAWLLRGEGAGLLIKTSGDNVVIWQAYSLSASRICYPDGHIWKLLSDAGPGGSNLPQFADNDFVDKTLYVPAIDPIRP